MPIKTPPLAVEPEEDLVASPVMACLILSILPFDTLPLASNLILPDGIKNAPLGIVPSFGQKLNIFS